MVLLKERDLSIPIEKHPLLTFIFCLYLNLNPHPVESHKPNHSTHLYKHRTDEDRAALCQSFCSVNLSMLSASSYSSPHHAVNPTRPQNTPLPL